MLMNISLKKRTLLVLLSTDCYFHFSAATTVARMAKPVCSGTEQTRSSHIRMQFYANASGIEKPGGYEQSPFI